MTNLGPIRIFDSRKARDRYENYKQYRSSDFIVPPGYIGLIELIGPEEYFPQITVTAVRIPTPDTGQDNDCYPECGIGKRYRRWKCSQTTGYHLSDNAQETRYSEYNGHIVYWGWDPFIHRIVEFEYIVRPGTYYLEANKCDNKVIEDCTNPIIAELSLQKHYPSYHDLQLPCVAGVWRPTQQQAMPSDDDPTYQPQTP